MISKSSLLSTGEVSKLLCVTSDTVLKWIKQEKLPAMRTAGGHYRVPREAVDALLQGQTESSPVTVSYPSEENLVYCWEFFADAARIQTGCEKCLVFRAHALKCFEMNHLPKDMGFNGGLCGVSCERCAYYRYHQGRPFKVLVVTDNPVCRENLTRQPESENMQLEFVTCEYDSSLVIHRFHPDFVVVDCTMQETKCRELCHHLANDPRIPDATLVLAVPQREQAFSLPGALRVRNPISLKELESHLSQERMCHSIQKQQKKERGNTETMNC